MEKITTVLDNYSPKFKEPTYDAAFGNWLAGFADGEGNFSMTENHGLAFRINLREDDKHILDEIRNKLGCGRIHFLRKAQHDSCRRDQYQYSVATVVDIINTVIPLFDKYQLRAKKKYDYIKWRNTILKRWKGVMQGG